MTQDDNESSKTHRTDDMILLNQIPKGVERWATEPHATKLIGMVWRESPYGIVENMNVAAETAEWNFNTAILLGETLYHWRKKKGDGRCTAAFNEKVESLKARALGQSQKAKHPRNAGALKIIAAVCGYMLAPDDEKAECMDRILRCHKDMFRYSYDQYHSVFWDMVRGYVEPQIKKGAWL